MAWFKVDDTFATSPKVMSIPRSLRMQCLGLWVTAGTWSAQHLTDGRIPVTMLEEWGAEVSQGDMLASCGLWERDTDSFVFHDWSDYQPTRTTTLAAREKERRRKEDWRHRNSGNSGQSPAGTRPLGANASQDPDPTRPDPTPKDSSAPAVRESDFDEAWAHWPKKTDRKQAFERFKVAARKLPVTDLVAAVIRFGDAYAASTETRFVPALGVWLGRERWTDAPPSPKVDAPRRDIAKNDEWMYR